MPVKFIAEVSSNHYQDIDRCYDFIKVASEIGCDAVKFQLFKVEDLFCPEVLKHSKNHMERKKWELPEKFIPLLAHKCEDYNIEFSCTPFYIDAVKILEPYVDFYKIASYELLWDNLILECAKTNKDVYLSTGMANMKEILHAVNLFSENNYKKPKLFHCTSAYPTLYNEANLQAIKTIRDQTLCEVGWSDHTNDPEVISRAIQYWNAPFIEFHLDLEGSGAEYKSGHCWLPNEISKVIFNTKKYMDIDGNGIKEPTQSELPDRDWRADPEDGLRPMKHIRDKISFNE